MRAARPPLAATVPVLLLLGSAFWALSANHVFLAAALKDRDLSHPSTWGYALALLVLVVAAHVLLLAPLANRHTVKPLLGLLTLVSAVAGYYTQNFGIYLDASMLRNVLRTDPAEATELLSLSLAVHLLLFAVLPIALLWRVQVAAPAWPRALLRQTALVLVTLLVAAGTLWAVFQPLSSMLRNHKEMRYLVTPANALWAGSQVVLADAKGAVKPRQPIGLDARPGASWAQRRKPLVVLLVVGETARAANWGLNGYSRQTTPRLADLPVLNFSQVQSCGTNTEVSLPCMFAPVGRRDYNEARIRGSESLLHVVARAGVQVHWRDNQSGCKGVCSGLPTEQVSAQTAPAACAGGRCLDEALVHDLGQRLTSLYGAGKPATPAASAQLWVLHMLGNHGPSYFRRYPDSFRHFLPDCRQDDLRLCSTQEVVNAYDNALRYTDHVLATAIQRLQARADQVDAALLYVSDHGESLGENGLFLHGMPMAIAPQAQTHVPMLMWTSAGFAQGSGLDAACLQSRLQQSAHTPLAHDHLFHTLLGLLDVRTSLHEPALDLSSACRSASAADAGPDLPAPAAAFSRQALNHPTAARPKRLY